MATIGLEPRERTAAALVAAGLVALLVWGLVAALAISPRSVAETALKVFGVAPPPPPPPPEPPPPHRPSYRAAGAAAPPAKRAEATPVVAPKPVVVLPAPSPVIAAPVPNDAAAPTQGAADDGSGSGAGGEGDGFGSGGDGRGSGAGDVPPRQIGGRIRDRDYPPEAARVGAQGVVVVRFYVGVDGSASRCSVTRSSGNQALDDTTCRLIEERFRFKPGHDARGHPFGAWLTDNREEWVLAHPPGEDRDDSY